MEIGKKGRGEGLKRLLLKGKEGEGLDKEGRILREYFYFSGKSGSTKASPLRQSQLNKMT